MADPLSITASIIAVASAGIKLTTVLGAYTTTVINADKSIRDIARDLSITSSVITELGDLLNQDRYASLHSAAALETAIEAVGGCDEVFRDIQKELDRNMGPEEGEEIGRGKMLAVRIRRLRWPMIEPKLHVLHARLERLKNTLVLMLNIVSYARRVAENESLWASDSLYAVPSSPDVQQRQIERLISLNEQANARYAGLEHLLVSQPQSAFTRPAYASPPSLPTIPEPSSTTSASTILEPLGLFAMSHWKDAASQPNFEPPLSSSEKFDSLLDHAPLPLEPQSSTHAIRSSLPPLASRTSTTSIASTIQTASLISRTSTIACTQHDSSNAPTSSSTHTLTPMTSVCSSINTLGAEHVCVDDEQVSPADLDISAAHLRKLLSAVDEARVPGNQMSRAQLQGIYRQSVESLDAVFAPLHSPSKEIRKARTMRRLFGRR